MKIPSIKKGLTFLIILVLIDCSLGWYIGIWREWYWGAVEHKQIYDVAKYIAYFSIVALTSCFVSGYSEYLTSYSSLLIRRKLTIKALKSDYHLIEGGPQRVQEDCLAYPALFIALLTGLMKNIINFIVFGIIMLSKIDLVYALLPIIYSLAGTAIATYIAYPLILLNYLNQNLEAKFRQVLNKINYAKVHRNNYNLFLSTKKLNYFQSFYNQVTVIIPYIILFPLYYVSKITFGGFMQVASAMHEVINSLSYIINVFSDINRFLSCRKRLKELNVI